MGSCDSSLGWSSTAQARPHHTSQTKEVMAFIRRIEIDGRQLPEGVGVWAYLVMWPPARHRWNCAVEEAEWKATLARGSAELLDIVRREMSCEWRCPVHPNCVCGRYDERQL